MSTYLSCSRMVRCFVSSLVVSLIFLASQAPARASTDDRGPLVVLRVVEESAAAKAGIHSGDFVVAVNGVPVPGRDLTEIISNIHGPIGGTVRLTVARFDGSRSEIALARTPYPPHVNPASDPFAYTVPGSWGTDPRCSFPLPWAPALAYRGFEDLFYVSNFDQTDSPEYHSYLFFLSLEGKHLLSAEQLQSDVLTF